MAPKAWLARIGIAVESPSAYDEPDNNEGALLPNIVNYESFAELSECYGLDDTGQVTFKCTSFILLDSASGTVYSGTIPTRKKQITLDQARGCFRKVPEAEIYQMLPPGFLLASEEGLGAEPYHVKRPDLQSYYNHASSTVIADLSLHKAGMCELAHENPHPNPVGYKSRIEKNGRIVGLAFKLYYMDLGQWLGGHNLESTACFNGVVSGTHHLHSLGLAHNNINLRSVLRGAWGWNERFDAISSPKNDEIRLVELKGWLQEATSTAGRPH